MWFCAFTTSEFYTTVNLLYFLIVGVHTLYGALFFFLQWVVDELEVSGNYSSTASGSSDLEGRYVKAIVRMSGLFFVRSLLSSHILPLFPSFYFILAVPYACVLEGTSAWVPHYLYPYWAVLTFFEKRDVQIRWNRFCDPMKKKNWCDVTERYNSGSWLLRTFLKPSTKMPSIFCEFGCGNRKLFANKSISFFSYNTGPNVNKILTHQHLK